MSAKKGLESRELFRPGTLLPMGPPVQAYEGCLAGPEATSSSAAASRRRVEPETSVLYRGFEVLVLLGTGILLRRIIPWLCRDMVAVRGLSKR